MILYHSSAATWTPSVVFRRTLSNCKRRHTQAHVCGVTLLGYFQIEPKPSGTQILVADLDVDEYVGLVAVVHVDASPNGLLYVGIGFLTLSSTHGIVFLRVAGQVIVQQSSRSLLPLCRGSWAYDFQF